jgi:hypothetical protein
MFGGRKANDSDKQCDHRRYNALALHILTLIPFLAGCKRDYGVANPNSGGGVVVSRLKDTRVQ